MEQQLDNFIHYLEAVRKSSRNTILSYKRDLEKFAAFLDAQAVVDLTDVNETTMNAYILMMEQKQFATSTISRNIAALKSFLIILNDMRTIRATLQQGLRPRKSRNRPRRY